MDSGFLIAQWPVSSVVRAVATTRLAPGSSLPPYDRCNLGLRSGDDLETVFANRHAVADALALPSTPVWLNQVHGTTTVSLSGAAISVASRPEPCADAATTRDPGVVLAVLSADCLPVLLAADDGRVVGAVHAGWRGLVAGVIESAAAAMAVAPGSLCAWLGPAIGPDDFEVGDEVRAAFVGADPVAAEAFRPGRPGHWYCDLYTLARQRLRRLGVERVTGGGLNTFGDAGRFHSYRRDGAASGRQASLIWIQPEAHSGS